MPKKEPLPLQGNLFRFVPTEKEIQSLPKKKRVRMLFELFVIREFETRLLELKDAGLVHGPVHSSIGQEGAAVGVMSALDPRDAVASTHRGHHHFLAKAFGYYLRDYDPETQVPVELHQLLERTLAEIMGLSQGFCRGRGGSMHLGDKGCYCYGTNAIVAGGVPMATGLGWSFALNNEPQVAVSFLGDGAVHQGVVHEVMNMANLWKIPVIYFIENNLYAVATSVKEASAVSRLAQIGMGYGLTCLVIDGMDPDTVRLAVQFARKGAVEGAGPFWIEAETYRYRHHAQSLPGSAFGYRDKEEEQRWQERDPYRTYSEKLIREKVLSEDRVSQLKIHASQIVQRVVDKLVQKQGVSLVVPEDLYPRAEELEIGIRSNGKELETLPYTEDPWVELEGSHPVSLPPDGEKKTYVDVISEVIGRRMEQDSRAFVIGEEVGHLKGGAYMATKGLSKRFPGRVIDTPISEAGFTGMSLGLALSGKRPIVEIMFPDFALVAADQLFNQIGKCRFMYGNQHDVPLIVRTRVSIGTGYGAQHSMEPASLFALFEGWRIVAPSTPFDYIGLFNTSYHSLDPVLIIEHQALYPMEGWVPKDRDYCIPFGKALIRRKGKDVTVVSYSRMVHRVLEAAELLKNRGIEVEVIDLRTLDLLGVDYETIGKSLKKTGRLLIVEEGHLYGGIGGHMADEVQRRFFDELDGEILRLGGKNLPMPVSKPLEALCIPDVKDIVVQIQSALQ
ncbi:MAG: dehydrogenase E1 component subunit alpha/beta [Spirochaetes bacterium]|nr:dehydrogenase E1 component subunit alpha/beta [Spirochaetota bacterium]